MGLPMSLTLLIIIILHLEIVLWQDGGCLGDQNIWNNKPFSANLYNAGEIMECAEDGYQGIELANCVENMIGGCYECLPCYPCLCQIIQWLGLGNC